MLTDEKIAILFNRLPTPLQFEIYLTRAFEEGFKGAQGFCLFADHFIVSNLALKEVLALDCVLTFEMLMGFCNPLRHLLRDHSAIHGHVRTGPACSSDVGRKIQRNDAFKERFADLIALAVRECMGNGEARGPYEFGCKVSVTIPPTKPKGGQFSHSQTELHGGWPALARVLDRATAALCAEISGGAQQVLDMTTAYAKIRIAFGRAIGGYHGVKHNA